jgi:RNA polymerase sigma factor (sigma-70 family)
MTIDVAERAPESQRGMVAARMAKLPRGRHASIDASSQADAAARLNVRRAELEAEAKARRPKHSGKVGNGDVTHSARPAHGVPTMTAAAKAARAEALAVFLAARDAQPRDDAATLTARNALVTLHMPFVVSMATRRARTGGHMEVADLIQAGALGAMRACVTFDPARSSFLTYAAWWIRSAINAALEGEPTIRQPARVLDDLRRLRRAENAHETRTGQRATTDELAAALKTTPGHVSRLLEAKRLGVTSLDADIEGEEGAEGSLHDLIAAADEPVDDAVTRGEGARVIREVVSRLPEREREVVERRGDDETFAAIGERFGVCRERVRQLESEAHRVIRLELHRRGLAGIAE